MSSGGSGGGGPISIANNQSNQMDRFLKSSIPQARRNPPILNRIFDKPTDSIDSTNAMPNQTGTFGGIQNRRL